MVNDPTSDVPLWHGQPITPGWWWLRFPDGPGPRHWDGTFWDRGGYFAGAEDYAEFPIIAPCPVPEANEPARIGKPFTELTFDQLVRECVELDVDAIVAGKTLYKRVWQVAELASRWAYERRVGKAVAP